MSHLDLNGLQRYAQKEKEWADSRFASTFDMNWQKTPAAGAVAFTPVPEMPIDPTVNFLFTESGPASGTKAPDNPSTIIGVSNVKVWRAGDNILPGNRKSNYSGEAGTFSTDADGYVSYSAMSDGRAFVYSLCNAQVYLHAGQQYVLRTEVKTAATSTYRTVHILDEDNTSVLSVSPGDSDNSHTFTPSHDGMYGVLYKIYDGTYRFSLYLGSTAASFEPYSGTDYTISLGGTYYGGSLDLSTGVMTVTHEKVLIDTFSQVSNVYASTVLFYFTISSFETSGFTVGQTPTWGCDKFNLIGDSSEEYARQSGNTRQLYISVDKSRLNVSGASDLSNPTMAEWLAAGKAWVANNIITFIAERETPAVIQLTPTQIYSLSQPDPYTPRVNTVYSDQVSVQVGYPKSPQSTAAEFTNAIISLGGNV